MPQLPPSLPAPGDEGGQALASAGQKHPPTPTAYRGRGKTKPAPRFFGVEKLELLCPHCLARDRQFRRRWRGCPTPALLPAPKQRQIPHTAVGCPGKPRARPRPDGCLRPLQVFVESSFAVGSWPEFGPSDGCHIQVPPTWSFFQNAPMLGENQASPEQLVCCLSSIESII